MIWLTIGLLALAVIASKAVGPVTLGARALPTSVRSVVSLMAPCLLAALIAVELLGAHWSEVSWTTFAGVIVAGLVRLVGRAPWIVAIVVGVATTSALRLLV
jgi:branched-subunit amino acid transport protein